MSTTKAKRPRKRRNRFPDIPDPFGYGQRAVDFLCSLKHPKSRLPDQAFQLDPWQEEIVRSIYGPCDKHGNRIAQSVVIMVPRGNRKTSLAAALTLLHTIGPEAVNGGEVLFAASDKKQAKIGLGEAAGVIQATYGDMWKKGQAARMSEAATGIRDQSYKNRILFPNGSFLEALSNDAGTQHGRTPVFALCDEIHAWPKRELWDVIDTGLTKTDNTLRVTITTAGRGQENLAYQVIDEARQIARGDVHDPSVLAFLYETPADADWRDEKVWKAANPGLPHGYPSLTGMRNKARAAERNPAAREAFRQLHLNVWLGHSTTPFVPMPDYDACKSKVDLSDLEASQEPVWIGVDLSTSLDLTAIVMAWGNPDTGFDVHAHFFGPETKVTEREADGVPYAHWASEEGGKLITITDGPVIDYRQVQEHIEELCATYRVEEIAFDPKSGAVMIANLLEAGLPVVEFPQGSQGMMAPAIKELERAIIGRKFRHDGNPALRWHFDNIATAKDRHDNVYFHKTKSKDRIDGAVACAMAVGRCAAANTGRSSYDTVKEWDDAWFTA